MKSGKTLTIIMTIGLVLGSNNSCGQTAEELLPKAIQLEEVKGDLDEAIKIYQAIINKYPGSRDVCAKALLRLGICYEKLGSEQASQVYRQLIKYYSENKEEVSVAKDRLANLERTLTDLKRKPKFRRIAIATKPQNGVMSPDGNKLAFTSDNGVWLVPLQGKAGIDIAGEPVRIADVKGAINFYNMLGWSADGQWIAVNGGGDGSDDIYIIPAAGGEPRKVRLPARGEGYYSSRLSLSPDGEKLAFSARELNPGAQDVDKINVYVIPLRGGEPIRISSGPGTFPAFSPDGILVAYITNTEKKEASKDVKETRYDSELWIVNSSGGIPVRIATADGRLGGPVWSPDSRFIAVTGRTDVGGKEIWIYPLSSDATSAGEPTIIALPGYSMGMLTGWTPGNELGVFIRSQFRSAVYTVPSSGGRAVQVTPDGVVYYPRWSPDGKRIFLRWVEPKQIPPVQIVYINADGGNMTKIPWPEKALMSRVPGGGHNISPDGKRLIVSAAEEPYNSFMDLHVIPLGDGKPVRLTNDKSHETYPCWSPDGQWIGFVEWQKTSDDKGYDAIYRMAAEGGKPVQITSEKDSVGPGAIAFSPDGKHIAFFSGKMIKTTPVEGGESRVLVTDVKSTRHSQLDWSPDGSKIACNADGKIWITTLATGKTAELRTGLPQDFYAIEFDWSPDGKKITFMTTSGDEPELWLISDFLPQNKK